MFSTSTQKPLRVFVESSWRSTSTNIWLQVMDLVLLHKQNLFCFIHTPAKDTGSGVDSSLHNFLSVKMADSILVFSTLLKWLWESLHSLDVPLFPKVCLIPRHAVTSMFYDSSWLSIYTWAGMSVTGNWVLLGCVINGRSFLEWAGEWDGGMQGDGHVSVAKSCF